MAKMQLRAFTSETHVFALNNLFQSPFKRRGLYWTVHTALYLYKNVGCDNNEIAIQYYLNPDKSN